VRELFPVATIPEVPTITVIKLLIRVATPNCEEAVEIDADLFRFRSASTLLGLFASAESNFVESVIDNTPDASKPNPIFETLSKLELIEESETDV
jgi:hypothetical protein